MAHGEPGGESVCVCACECVRARVWISENDDNGRLGGVGLNGDDDDDNGLFN